jgi:propanediol dehydratase large subunit
VVVPTQGEALGARFHARVAITYAIETDMTEPDAAGDEVSVTHLEERA